MICSCGVIKPKIVDDRLFGVEKSNMVDGRTSEGSRTQGNK
jgi:hypothetical protein